MPSLPPDGSPHSLAYGMSCLTAPASSPVCLPPPCPPQDWVPAQGTGPLPHAQTFLILLHPMNLTFLPTFLPTSEFTVFISSSQPPCDVGSIILPTSDEETEAQEGRPCSSPTQRRARMESTASALDHTPLPPTSTSAHRPPTPKPACLPGNLGLRPQDSVRVPRDTFSLSRSKHFIFTGTPAPRVPAHHPSARGRRPVLMSCLPGAWPEKVPNDR